MGGSDAGGGASHRPQPFPTAVQALATPMVRSGVEVYLRTRARFPPLPAKPHYLFDLRDLARAFQGAAPVRPLVRQR